MGKIALVLLFVFSWTGLAVEYSLKLPVPSTAKVEEANGILTIATTFKPTRAFNAQLNRKVDRKHAERICREALRRFFEVDAGSIAFSGLQYVGTPIYSNESASYTFSLPKKAVKVTLRSTGGNSTRVSSSSVPGATVLSSSRAKPETNVALADGKTLIPSTSSSHDIPSGPLNRQLITDDEIEKLPMMGYSVRLKQDFQASIELKREEFIQCQKDADWDALVSICSLRKELASIFDINAIREKYKFDSQLTGRDLDILLQFITNEKSNLESEIAFFHRQLFISIRNELSQRKTQLSSEVKTALPSDRESVAEELRSIEELIKELDSLKP